MVLTRLVAAASRHRQAHGGDLPFSQHTWKLHEAHVAVHARQATAPLDATRFRPACPTPCLQLWPQPPPESFLKWMVAYLAGLAGDDLDAVGQRAGLDLPGARHGGAQVRQAENGAQGQRDTCHAGYVKGWTGGIGQPYTRTKV